MSPNTTSDLTLTDLNSQEATRYNAIIALICTFFLPGLLGNSQVLHIYIYKKKHNNTRVYICFLAVLGIVNSVVCYPIQIVKSFYPFAFYSDIACRIFTFVTFFVNICLYTSLLMIAVDRFHVMYRPFHDRISERSSKTRCKVTIAVSIALSIPSAILYESVSVKTDLENVNARECNLSSSHYPWPVLYTGLLFLLFLLEAVILFVLYFFMYMNVGSGQTIRTSGKRNMSISSYRDDLLAIYEGERQRFEKRKLSIPCNPPKSCKRLNDITDSSQRSLKPLGHITNTSPRPFKHSGDTKHSLERSVKRPYDNTRTSTRTMFPPKSITRSNPRSLLRLNSITRTLPRTFIRSNSNTRTFPRTNIRSKSITRNLPRCFIRSDYALPISFMRPSNIVQMSSRSYSWSNDVTHTLPFTFTRPDSKTSSVRLNSTHSTLPSFLRRSTSLTHPLPNYFIRSDTINRTLPSYFIRKHNVNTNVSKTLPMHENAVDICPNINTKGTKPANIIDVLVQSKHVDVNVELSAEEGKVDVKEENLEKEVEYTTNTDLYFGEPEGEVKSKKSVENKTINIITCTDTYTDMRNGNVDEDKSMENANSSVNVVKSVEKMKSMENANSSVNVVKSVEKMKSMENVDAILNADKTVKHVDSTITLERFIGQHDGIVKDTLSIKGAGNVNAKNSSKVLDDAINVEKSFKVPDDTDKFPLFILKPNLRACTCKKATTWTVYTTGSRQCTKHTCKNTKTFSKRNFSKTSPYFLKMKRVTRMFSLITFIYVISFLPTSVLRMLVYLDKGWYDSLSTTGQNFYHIVMGSVFLVSVSNFFIYLVADSKFRRELRLQYTALFCRCRPKEHVESTQIHVNMAFE